MENGEKLYKILLTFIYNTWLNIKTSEEIFHPMQLINKLLPILLIPVTSNADIDMYKDFPAIASEILILEACCDTNATCCVNFGESMSINDFKNKVKSVDTYRSGAVRSRLRTLEIQQRLNRTQREYDNRFNNIGGFNYNN
jgi:hypothetical protein